MKAGRRRAGLTLIEATISLTIITIIGGIVVMVTGASFHAFETGTSLLELDAVGRRTLDRICSRLKDSGRNKAGPAMEAPFYTTAVDFQRSLGAPTGSIQWGDLERFALETTAQGRQVVWTTNPGLPTEQRVVVCTGVAILLEGEAANGIDDNGNGLLDEPGFCVDFGGDGLTVRLTLERLDVGGRRIIRTFERTLAFRNSGS